MIMRKALVIRATSAITQVTARRFSEVGGALLLIARTADRLPMIADDLRVCDASGARCRRWTARLRVPPGAYRNSGRGIRRPRLGIHRSQTCWSSRSVSGPLLRPGRYSRSMPWAPSCS